MADATTSPAPPQATFDVAGARKAGYSNAEIADYLGSQSSFDVAGARKAGYDDGEIIGYLAAPKPAPAPDEDREPDQPKDGLLSAIGKGIASVPAAIERAGGAALRALGEQTPSPNIMVGEQEQQDLDQGPAAKAIQASADVPGAPAHIGKQIYEAADQHLRQMAPNVAAGSLSDIAYKTALGIGEILPAVVLGAISKSPVAAAAAIGGQAYVEKYAEARENDRSIDQATADAGFTGLLNGSMATLPLGVLMKPGGTFLGKALSVVGANAFQGVVTDAVQMGYDKGVLKQDMPLSDAISRLKETGIISAVTGGLLGAGEHAIGRITGQHGTEPPPSAPTPEESAAPVMQADTVDDAIMAAQNVMAEPIDIESEGLKAVSDADREEAPFGDFLDEMERPIEPAAIEPEQGSAAPTAVSAETAPPATRDVEPEAAAPVAEQAPAAAPEIPPDEDQAEPETQLQGRVRGRARRLTTGDEDAAMLLAANGGIRNDEGHDLVKGRGLQQFVPGLGPLVRPKGMSIDAAGELLWDRGFFGPPDSTPRPSENEVLQLLEQTRRGADNRPTKVYPVEVQAQLDEARQAQAAQEDNDRMAAEVRDVAHSFGEPLDDSDVAQILSNIGAHGLDTESAVVEHIERKAIQELQSDHDETGDTAYAQIAPIGGTAGEDDLGAGEGGEGQTPFTEGKGGPGEEGGPAAPYPGEARPVTAEPGAAGFDQTIIPGAEQSARQLAQAREAAGRGRIQPRAPQRDADQGLFGPSEDDEPLLFSARAPSDEPIAPTFFSALTRGVEALKMEKATPGQWEGAIRNMPGVKSEEVDWSGMMDWLRAQPKSVSKADLMDHLRQNEVQVQEVHKGLKPISDEEAREYHDMSPEVWDAMRPGERAEMVREAQRGAAARRYEEADQRRKDLLPAVHEMLERHGLMGFDRRDEARGAIRDDPEAWDYETPGDRALAHDYSRAAKEAIAAREDAAGETTKFGSYVLPGGENYRELLLTMPERAPELPNGYTVKPFQQGFAVFDGAGDEVAWAPTRGGALANAAPSIARTVGASPTFRSSHWDEPNILAHIRFDDRAGPNGEKVLHVAEVQSDWHQAGRRKGYQGPPPRMLRSDYAAGEIHVEEGKHDWYGRTPDGIEARVGKGVEPNETGAREYLARYLNQKSESSNRQVIGRRQGLVPDAPFKTSWHELAMKRILRYAAEHGYDRVSWDAGETQATRYDLSKQVDAVRAQKQPSGDFILAVQKKGSTQWEWLGADVPKDKVADYVGKDLAEKIVAEANQVGDNKTYSGLDLKVGGEGMKGFYDKILPNSVNKLAKKWGAKVEPSEIEQVGALGPGHYKKAPVHSIAITPAMRESVMRGQPLFAPGERKAPVVSNVKGAFSPAFNARRAEVAAALRAELDRLGLRQIALKVPDYIKADGVPVDGVYARRIMAVALDAVNPHMEVLNHEAIHALRALGLFTKSEWSILRERAARDWRSRFEIDERYEADFGEDRLLEEAVAEAYREWAANRGAQQGTVARIFNKVRNALSAIRNVLRGHGFQSADDIFARIDRGEVGARSEGSGGETAPAFSRRVSSTPDEMQQDEVSDLIAAAAGGEGQGPTSTQRALTKIAQAGIKQIKNLNILEAEFPGTIFPRTLASLDDMSAELWRPWIAREEAGHAIGEGLRRVVSDSLVKLDPASRDRVYAALELSRKFEWRPPDDGRLIRVRNTSYWQARKSKVGDDYVLTPAETKAFHDTLRLGDEGWRAFVTGLARREGWNGPADPEAIRRAANDGKGSLPEGKRLLKLADMIEAAQGAMKRPYFPAMRFGDYFIAVRPKPGADDESTGGFPRVEWFETVEKPVMQDILGKARVSHADFQGVRDALARIKEMRKPDGSLAFPADKYDFTTGDLRAQPNVLRQLNIPALEKLFMLMERGVTDTLRDKIMATNTPDEGLGAKDAAALKREARGEAAERYEALLGEAKDTLLDAIYHDLLAGWKKRASLVPGYSADFDRAIGTHIGQVSRNAADLSYRNAIEDAYTNLQTNHPHYSVREYWQHWRAYQENPRHPLARAAASTAQIGATYVMGMNPSTTLMIQAHTPVMAVPVLSVGGGMGQAVAQMGRALRETYGALAFDKNHGANINTSKLGKTDREKALIADLEKAGLNHSVGADDVRALNDRQAGLWGAAAPTVRKGLDIAMSNISAVDQANRNAIALATHRMAMNPAMLDKLAAPWLEHNAIFRRMVKDEGLTPENFTRFMMSEAAGAWGRTNQAPMMRGVEGSLLFTLHGFQTRFLSTTWKLMRNMGPQGRVGAAWMMAALWAATGVYGLPFTQDLENAGTLLWKKLTGVDPMIDARVREFLADMGLGKIGAEIALRGPLSVMSGIDLGARMGFGDIITESVTAADLLGTIPSILLGRLEAAWNRVHSGQGVGAAAVELLPAALRNPARALIEGQRGQRSQSGTMLLPAKNFGPAHQILRSLGLPPLDAEQAYARSEYLSKLRERDDELRRRTEMTAANLINEAARADKDGDYALAHELTTQLSKTLSAYNRDHWQAPVTAEGLNDTLRQMMNPELERTMRMPKALRAEALHGPYP